MVHEEIWLSAVPGYDGMLCIGCLEDKLGRKLIPADFTNCPLNIEDEVFTKSDRLLDRMGKLQ